MMKLKVDELYVSYSVDGCSLQWWLRIVVCVVTVLNH